MASVHPRASHHIRVRVGRLPAQAAAAAAQGLNPLLYDGVRHWADAIATYPDRALVFEGKFKLRADALGQIIVNGDLFGITPEFKEWWNKPLERWVIYAFGDPETEEALSRRGIMQARYCPEWAREARMTRALRGRI